MVYILPQSYICPKCGTRINYSPHDDVINFIADEDGNPFCPVCYKDFLTKNVPRMEREDIKPNKRIKPTLGSAAKAGL